MKYLCRLFVCLTAFFLVVAVSKAQVTKTLNGIVRYESGMSETKLSTPNGNVLVKLPQSMSGTTITGTVYAEPSGKTEKEKSRNLKELLKHTVMLDGQKIPVTGTPTNFDWLTHLDRQQRTPMELLNASGSKIAEVSLPPVLSKPAMTKTGTAPNLSTPSNVLVKGDMLNVYTNQQFSPGEKFVLTDSKGQQFTLTPICLSSQQAVMTVPKVVVPGNCTIREEVTNQPLNSNNISSADFKMIDIDLSSPNTNLRRGQTSSVTVVCHESSGSGITANERELFLSTQQVLTIDLRNLEPNTVSMAGGNLQRIHFPMSDNQQDVAPLQITRTITGIKPGSFSVSATLHEDYTTSNDPFRPQLNVLKTPEDFNAWANALKKDLKEYATFQTKGTIPMFDGFDNILLQTVKVNTQRAIDNMPVCTSPEQLDESKAVAYSLIRPLNVSKGVANNWLSNYEAFKTASKVINDNLTGNPGLIDFDVIKNGLAYISRLADKQLVEYDLKNGTTEAGKLVSQMETQSETKETLEKLNEGLGSLQTLMNRTQSGMPAVMKMLLPGGLLFLTNFPPPHGTPDSHAEVTEMYWGKLPSDDTKDVISVNIHFTDEMTLKKLTIRVKCVSKEGKAVDADLDWTIKKGTDYYRCQNFPIGMVWPDDFKSPTGGKLVPKSELDLDKTKVLIIVNGVNAGEGKPDEGKPKD